MTRFGIRSKILLALLMVCTGAAFSTAHAQTFSVVYNFGVNTGDPGFPSFSGAIAQGRDGILYSTTDFGGDYFGAQRGAMFSMTPSGGVSVPYSFPTVEESVSGLTLGTDGNFYGSTYQGGTFGSGTLYQTTSTGAMTLLYTFTGSGTDGAGTFAPPVEGNDGNYYGTTYAGGTNSLGMMYKVTPGGIFSALYSFDTTHGYDVFGPLVLGNDGNFYGTASQGGSNADGVVFKITTAGKITVLYNFDITHGYQPVAPLVQGSDGNFYGSAIGGGSGSNPEGVIFKITPGGTLTVLHTLNNLTDGSGIYGALVQATDGNYYGATSTGGIAGYGTIFKISPISPYTFTVLYNFDSTTGSTPYGALVQHTNGILYGDTSVGGTGSKWCFNCGVFYSLNIGAAPFASLVSTSGKVAASIGILGQGFTGTTKVSFGATSATYTVVSDTYLTATVPSGATTGAVTVITPGRTLTSNKAFRVTPSIRSFSPTSGAVGTVVTIMGVSLKQTSKVTFGGVAATSITVNSDTKVTATVPTGARTGKIGITTKGGIATSSGTFTVTP